MHDTSVKCVNSKGMSEYEYIRRDEGMVCLLTDVSEISSLKQVLHTVDHEVANMKDI